MQYIKEAFDLFDRDLDGKIAVNELGMVMRSAGAIPTDSELRDLGAELSAAGKTAVSFNEFLPLIARYFRGDSEKELQAAFKVFDKEGKGYLDSKELRHILTTLGEKLTEKEAEQFFREVDPQNTGRVTFERYMNVLLIK